MKFFEKVVFKDGQEFKKLSTEDQKRYVTLFGHYHFSGWLASLVVSPWTSRIVMGLAIILLLGNTLISFFVEAKEICLTVLYITVPVIIFLMFFIFYICRILKLEKKAFYEWLEKTSEKIQNVLFSDFRVVSIRKWRYLKKTNKQFYMYLHSEECRGHCYECSFKLAKILNDPEIKIIWISAIDVDTSKYGHAVIERKGRILDTNTRKSYNKDQYLKAQKAEIFKEYVLEEYQKVERPWDLQWSEFGEWCKVRDVQRSF
ncbi:MAG: hypothetical protein E7314_04800 [Clostridiales bacterium]|nr:hypothetical protein [Clostridiales bacterium]